MINAFASVVTRFCHQSNTPKKGETLFVFRAILMGSLGEDVGLCLRVGVHSPVGERLAASWLLWL